MAAKRTLCDLQEPLGRPPRRKRKRARSPYKAPPGGVIASQRALLECVHNLTQREGKPPSALAVSRQLGISRIVARKRLRLLAASGLLLDVPKAVSSGLWTLTEAGREAWEKS